MALCPAFLDVWQRHNASWSAATIPKILNPIYVMFPARKIAICMERHCGTVLTFMLRVYGQDLLWQLLLAKNVSLKPLRNLNAAPGCRIYIPCVFSFAAQGMHNSPPTTADRRNSYQPAVFGRATASLPNWDEATPQGIEAIWGSCSRP